MSDVDTRITPALHPDSLKSLDGYTEETKAVAAPVATAFSEAYEGLRSIWSAKEAVAKNPTMNEAAKLIQVDDFATKKVERLTRLFDTTRANLVKGISFLEGELSQPVKALASSSVSAEIRQHVKVMSTGERQTFLQQAINTGDDETVSAALGAKHYLSGLTEEMQGALVRLWHTKQQPEKAARLRVMQAAKAKIERDAPLLFKAVADAVGFITEPKSQRKIYASELRKQRFAAEQPFKDA